jgi:hypothetical protein
MTALHAPTTVLSSALVPTLSAFATVAALFLRRSLLAWLALTVLSLPLPSAPSLVRTFTSATALAFVSFNRDARHRLTIPSFLYLFSL